MTRNQKQETRNQIGFACSLGFILCRKSIIVRRIGYKNICSFSIGSNSAKDVEKNVKCQLLIVNCALKRHFPKNLGKTPF